MQDRRVKPGQPGPGAPRRRGLGGQRRPQQRAGPRRGQNVWLRLAGPLAFLRNPAALPGWLATTQRECGQIQREVRKREVRKQEAAGRSLDAADIPDNITGRRG
jgi:hypothetical protein